MAPCAILRRPHRRRGFALCIRPLSEGRCAACARASYRGSSRRRLHHYLGSRPAGVAGAALAAAKLAAAGDGGWCPRQDSNLPPRLRRPGSPECSVVPKPASCAFSGSPSSPWPGTALAFVAQSVPRASRTHVAFSIPRVLARSASELGDPVKVGPRLGLRGRHWVTGPARGQHAQPWAWLGPGLVKPRPDEVQARTRPSRGRAGPTGVRQSLTV